jgi:DNA-binding transcriptional LysR family regulator
MELTYKECLSLASACDRASARDEDAGRLGYDRAVMNERQLEYVVAIAETGSFTAAAERSHTAQSALSYQIARLESHLGTRLFDRTSRSVRLTEAGQALLPVARRILGDLTDLRTELRAIDGQVRGPLRIGATQTAVRVLNLLQLLADYDKGYPDVELSVTIGPGYEFTGGIQSGEFDVAFAALDGGAPRRDIRFVPLGRIEPLVAVVAADHPLAGRASVRLEQLAEAGRFIDFRPRTTLWNKVQSLCEAAGIQRRVMCELGNIPSMVELASTGVAAAIVPRAFTERQAGQAPAVEGIRVLPLAEPDSYLVMGFFCTDGTLMAPPVRAFVELFSPDRHVLG